MRVAIIPARGGSRRIPHKNIRMFHGKPIIAYSIEAAKGPFESVWVSTDDAQIAAIAEQFGASVLFRPKELAHDEVGTQEVMRHALRDIQAEIVGCIYATAPMLCQQTLYDALAAFTNSFFSYLVPVATWLRDPGQFYLGTRDAFIKGRPLLATYTMLFPIDPKTECDINTEDDWRRAEQMYAELRKEAA